MIRILSVYQTSDSLAGISERLPTLLHISVCFCMLIGVKANVGHAPPP